MRKIGDFDEEVDCFKRRVKKNKYELNRRVWLVEFVD